MQNIRNIAIIAHVDHGKTTLVDKMLLAGNLFRENQQTDDLMLDNNELERERGITILSKNVSINYKGTKINIIDTPGHSDFGGEVERVLNMADGCILLVDAFEGPMPQTRFVLQKALQIGLKPIVVVNKVDKPNCRPEEVYEMVFDLMCDLDATEEQLDFPVIYGSAKNGWMSEDWQKPTDNIFYLLDSIVENIPAPVQLEGTPQMLITSLDYSNYTGRIAVGRVHRGTLREGMNITVAHRDGSMEKTRIKELHTFTGMGRQRIQEVGPSMAATLLGFNGAPQAGDQFHVMETEQEARDIANRREQLQREQDLRTREVLTLEKIGKRLKMGSYHELNIIVKADVDGSVEALADSFIKLSTENIVVKVIYKGVGQISENDVTLAAASDAVIVGFQVRPSQQARKLAERDGVEIRQYSVIYDAIEDVKEAMEGMLEPVIKEEITANIEVRQVYHISKVGYVAGAYVLDGKVKRSDKARLIRDGIVIFTGEINALKRFKDDVKEVNTNFECGISLTNCNDIKEGDIIETFQEVEVKQKL